MSNSYTVKTCDGEILAGSTYIATSLPKRIKGLLGKTCLAADEALLIDPCTSIHTIGMKFSIDVVFLDRKNRIVGAFKDVPPNRLLWSPRKTRKTLELAAGSLKPQHLLKKHLEFERNEDSPEPT